MSLYVHLSVCLDNLSENTVSLYDVSSAAGSRQLCLRLDKPVIRWILSVRISFHIHFPLYRHGNPSA